MTTVIPITTKRSTKTARKWNPHFALVFTFSKQLPNSHLYDYRHPFNHRKVHQNDPPNDSTFCILKLYIFPIESAFEYFNEMSLAFWSGIHLKDRIKLLCCSEIEIQRIYHKLEIPPKMCLIDVLLGNQNVYNVEICISYL